MRTRCGCGSGFGIECTLLDGFYIEQVEETTRLLCVMKPGFRMGTITTMSGQQFDALPYEEGRRWELVSGDLIDVSRPTPEHQLIVQRIVFALMQYLQRNPQNGIVLSDIAFAMGPDTRVRPGCALAQC